MPRPSPSPFPTNRPNFFVEPSTTIESLRNSSTRCEPLASRCSSTPSKDPLVEKEEYHPKCALSSRHSCHIKKSDIKALADQIVDVVIRNLPDNPGRTAVDNIRDGCLPAGIDSISMIRFSKQTSVFFFAPRSGWIPMIDAAYLQRTIDEKATHLQGYLTACAEAWLLMVEEGSNPSNTVEMPDELWKHAYDFRGFARLFVLRCTRTIH